MKYFLLSEIGTNINALMKIRDENYKSKLKKFKKTN